MMNEQTQQALRTVCTHASWIDAEMDESTLAEVRAANGILDSDHCAWVSGSPPESGTTCAEHFGFDA